MSACVALLALTVISGMYDLYLGIAVPGTHDAGIEVSDAAVTLWWHRDATWPGEDGKGGVWFRAMRSWGGTANIAWRPYHVAASRFPRPSPHHGLVIPLWALLVWSLLLSGYAHGLIVGARRATIGRCRVCGYDLRSLPKGAACPECGPGAQAPDPVVTAARSSEKSFTKSGS